MTGGGTDGTPFEHKVTAAMGGNPACTASWARAHVRDLEDRYACLAGRGTAELARLEQQITDVSLRYGVLCRFTAFVAVDSRVVTDGAAPHRVTQPVELPARWDPVGLGLPPAVGWYAAMGAMPAPASPGRVRATPMAARHAATMKSFASAAAVAPAGTAPRGGDVPGLVRARRQLAAEAAALRAAHDAPEGERVRLLADLATRIDALLAWLGGDPAVAGQLAGLAGLASKLRACDGPEPPRGGELAVLWQEAIRLLTGFAAGADPAARSAFWKRPR